jgi:cell wall-associated NlpC family hydrolase
MKKKAVKLIGVAMAFTMAFLPSGAVYASTINDIKKQQAEDQNKLNSVQGQISGLQGQQSEVSGEIDELDANVVEIIASVDIIKDEIVEKEEQIVETEAEYEVAKQQEEEQYAAMKLRIKFMYEQGDISYVQLLMTSDSLGDMVNKADYIEQLYEYDRKMLEEYQAAKEYVQQVWNQLEDEKSELEASRHELEEEQAYMEELLEEKKQEYENYNVQIAKAKQEAAAYKTKIKQQTAQIKKLEEEARKKAEEEERKRKEAAAAAAANGGDSSSSSSSSGSSSSSSSSGSSVSIPSGGSGSGQAIASYACQFIGNPYVAGGTSLTDGADCSGFVWRVFKDKGYSVPRTSWEIRDAGSGVDYSQAQPGDVICYAGHVGIYIGNGNIVHASTERSGIKITSATYKSILSVRRIA